MKAKIPFITAACLAACALCASPAFAKGKKSPAPEATASPAASVAATDKPARPIPYHGKVASVDASAKTFTVGKRTIKVTDETKITKQDAAATMADIVVDEQVRGSYWKKEDGTLEAKSVKLGAKSADAAAATEAQKKEDKGSAEAAPSVSPKP
jgi:hypothetical protein